MARDHTLDAARGILMMLGIVLHTSQVYAVHIAGPVTDWRQSIVFDAMAQAVHVFRMPAFFWIAGYFAVSTFDRLGAKRLLKRRLPRLLLPLASTWLTFNVAQEYLIALHFNRDPVAAILDGVPIGHLWFLLDLAILVVIGAAALHLTRHWHVPVPEQIARRTFWLIGSCAMFTYATEVAAGLWGWAHFTPFGLTNLYRLATYGSYFAVGALMYRHPQMMSRFLHTSPAWLLLSLPIAIALQSFNADPSRLVRGAAGLSETISIWLSVAAVLGLFNRLFREESRIASFLADASYSVFLSHVLIMVAFAILLIPFGLSPYLKFATTCLGTLLLSLALHVAIIRRVRVCRYLFNGIGIERPPPRRRTPALPVVDGL